VPASLRLSGLEGHTFSPRDAGDRAGWNTRRTSKPRYNCAKCPAYCCTYPRTPATDADIRRLAKGLGKPVDYVREKYTKEVEGERVLRHKQDEIFETCCRFLDVETRRCTVYEHRPRICRSYPGTVRCGYYDFLVFERRAQNDPEYVALT
jgi:Fe-S-cluster containining protein